MCVYRALITPTLYTSESLMFWIKIKHAEDSDMELVVCVCGYMAMASHACYIASDKLGIWILGIFTCMLYQLLFVMSVEKAVNLCKLKCNERQL